MKTLFRGLVLLLALWVSSSVCFSAPFVPKLTRTRCILMGVMGGGTQSDPAVTALLTRIADQQAQLLANQQAAQLIAAQARPQTDPQLTALLSQMASQQERILTALANGKDTTATELMRQLITGQERILTAIAANQHVVQPPIIPPANGPVIVLPPANNPPAGTPIAGGALNSIPGLGGPIQALPGPGGALNLIPPAGGSLQALPGPGGSITILPGGVKPPDGTKPLIGGPPSGGTTPPVPGAGPPLGGIPEAKDPVVFKTIYQRPITPTRR